MAVIWAQPLLLETSSPTLPMGRESTPDYESEIMPAGRNSGVCGTSTMARWNHIQRLRYEPRGLERSGTQLDARMDDRYTRRYSLSWRPIVNNFPLAR